MAIPPVKIYLLPGGVMPKRKTVGAVGFDVSARAIVSRFDMDPEKPQFRKTLFDFKRIPEDPRMASKVLQLPKKDGTGQELIYRMDPGEQVLVGIGFVAEIAFPWYYEIEQRSGLSTRWRLAVTNIPIPIDSDYRGEAGAFIQNQNECCFDLRHGMRITQITFKRAETPEFIEVAHYDDLSKTIRGANAFGSTGLK